jgi:glycosyltransferase involved in cell wall biosynthesis
MPMTHKTNGLRIALIGPTYPYKGGIAHYTTQLYEHLKQRHTVTFISYKKQYPAWLYPGKTDIDPSKIPIAASKAQRIIDSTNPVTWFKAAYVIVKSKPDILIMPWWVAFWAPVYLIIISLTKIFTKIRILFICHNVVEHESSFWKKMLTSIVLRWGNLFIVHSKEDETNLQAIIRSQQITRTFLPVGTFANQISKISKSEARQILGLTGKKVILFFGFIREYKGLRYLLEAMPSLLKSDPDIFLFIAGEFWNDKKTYTDLIEKLKIGHAVRIVDEYIPNEQVAVYFNATDIVAIPYTSATGSAIIQTAYDFGKPVVATKVGSMLDIVRDGVTGILVETKNATQLASAIASLFKSDTYKKFEENVISIQKTYTWNALIDKIEEIIGYKR